MQYPHPLLEPCLKETFGVIIYQEQVMQIAQILAGYSLGQADLLRRAMGKKIKAEMDAQQETFVNGCLKNNIKENTAKDIFALVAKFAGYGFNKSHAAAYAKIGYHTAYLKAHYPTEFITATLNLDIHDTDKINLFIQEAKNLNITILPPHINYSHAYFTVEIKDNKKAIRYGLAALKSVSLKSIEELQEIRKDKKNGFSSITDLLKSTNSKIIQKRQLESLIKAGSLDDLESNRAKLLNSVEFMIKNVQYFEAEKLSNQQSLFAQDDNDEDDITLPNHKEFQLKEKLQKEFEAVGFYLSKHPLDNLDDILKKNNISSSHEIIECKLESYNFNYAGVIINYKQRSGKNGRFVTLNISDPQGVLDISIFDEDLISNIRELLYNGSIVVINANLRNDNNGSRIIVSRLVSIDSFLKKQIQTVNLKINNLDELHNKKRILTDNPGILPVKLLLNYRWQKHNFNINPNEVFYTDINIYKNLIKN